MIHNIEIPIDFDDDIEIELNFTSDIELPVDFLDMVEIELMGEVYLYQEETLALLDRMDVSPDSSRKVLIDQTIKSLKKSGVWDILDTLQVRSMHNAQAGLLDWVTDREAIAVNSPAFEIDRGYTGNGSNSYIDTNYNPSAPGNKYQLSDCSWGFYRRTSTNNLAHITGGAFDTAATYFRWMTTNGDTITFNSVAFVFPFPVSPSPHIGWRIFSRNNSSTINDYINKTLLASRSLLETGIPNLNFFQHAVNANGTPGNFSSTQIAIFFAGGYMTQQNVNDLVDIMENFLDVIGAGVIA